MRMTSRGTAALALGYDHCCARTELRCAGIRDRLEVHRYSVIMLRLPSLPHKCTVLMQ